MNDRPASDPIVGDPDRMLRLQFEIQEFLYREAELIDEREFEAWLDLFSDDLIYFMPIRRNVAFGTHAQSENTRQGEGISWFDEDKWTLTKRVEQIRTGVHYAEEPLSRTTHMVTNVRVATVEPSLAEPEQAMVKSCFLVYQNRVEYETNTFVGKRIDTLRRVNGSWKISRREIILDQSILLAKNLSTFF
jgi:3-phenylpropionate/cinnamic acid dioxygenase small subunit